MMGSTHHYIKAGFKGSYLHGRVSVIGSTHHYIKAGFEGLNYKDLLV